ncbi:histone-fold-containing protein [Lipomyces chichibuensis]|uniref:histone-fold-containing protein n=1 Tax=Lipomyces chichibuensis TaxID=1546026 RepID=UPI003342FAFE
MPRGVKKSAGQTALAEGNPTVGDVTGVPTASHSQDKEKDKAYGIDDYMLPKATVTRLAKHVLPANTQIQKDAMTALSKSATVFINYLTSTANDLTVGAGRRTVNPSDVYKAIELLELEFILPRLKAEVDKFVEVASTKHKKPTKGEAANDGESEIVVPGAEREVGEGTPVVEDDDAERITKKAKVGNGKVVARKPSVRDEDETEVEDTEEDEGEEEEEEDAEQPDDGSSAEDTFEDAKDGLEDDGHTLEMGDAANFGGTRSSSRDRVLAKDPDALSVSEEEDSD